MHPVAAKTVMVAYNGKVVDMSYVSEPKARFKFGCLRVVDNAAEGYVMEGERIYYVTRSRRMARPLSGEEYAQALKLFAAPLTLTQGR